MSKGKLYGIGVGPGDSKLLTVKAVETIRNADMIRSEEHTSELQSH